LAGLTGDTLGDLQRRRFSIPDRFARHWQRARGVDRVVVAQLGLQLASGRRIPAMSVLCVRGPLRKLVGGRGEHELEGATVVELLRALEHGHPDVIGWILDERGLIRRHLNVFVNGERAGEATAVRSRDRVEVVAAITGG
jgi:molybdopterin synthase sulfur carrier subunit